MRFLCLAWRRNTRDGAGSAERETAGFQNLNDIHISTKENARSVIRILDAKPPEA